MRTSIRKLLALLLALLMLSVCLTACGNKKDEKSKKDNDVSDSQEDENDEDQVEDKDKDKDKEDESDPINFYQKGHVKLGTPGKTLNPENVYDNLTYTEEFLCGDYTIPGGEKAQNRFAKKANYIECVDPEHTDGSTIMLSEVPYRMEAGPNSTLSIIANIEGYDWMCLYFMKQYSDGDCYLDFFYGAYTVEGNSFTIRFLQNYEWDTETNVVHYAFSDVTMTFDFSFSGRDLTLTRGDSSVTMRSGMDYNGEYDLIYISGYLRQDSPALGNLDRISLCYDASDKYRYFSADGLDGDWCYEGIVRLEENGLITITLPWNDGDNTVTYQYVCFLCDDDGIILTDGTNTYFYTDSYQDRYSDELDDYIGDDVTGQFGDLSEEQVQEIVQTKDQLMAELEQAFENEGISVTVDAATGEMAMDASILFGGDSAVLTDTGKDFIRRFVKVYTTVTANTKYADFISHTMVEGHTAPVGNSSYEEGLPLSEERAAVVKAYCLSLTEYALQDSDLEDIGYSNSKPIKDKDGKVDMAASRRVSFRFIINLDKYLK